MESNDELREANIRNWKCYYFCDITKIEDFLFYILLDKKWHENILVYDISYKTLIIAKPLRIRLTKVDGFMTNFDVTRHLLLFGDYCFFSREKNSFIIFL